MTSVVTRPRYSLWLGLPLLGPPPLVAPSSPHVPRFAGPTSLTRGRGTGCAQAPRLGASWRDDVGAHIPQERGRAPRVLELREWRGGEVVMMVVG